MKKYELQDLVRDLNSDSFIHLADSVEADSPFLREKKYLLAVADILLGLNRCGRTLLDTHYVQKLIEIILESDLLKTDTDVKEVFVNALSYLGYFSEATRICKSLILESPEKKHHYRTYSYALEGEGKYEDSERAILLSRDTSIIQNLFLPNTYTKTFESYSHTDVDTANALQQYAHSRGMSCAFSYESEYNLKSQWRNVINIHIPKCGGTSFYSPLYIGLQAVALRPDLFNPKILENAKKNIRVATYESYASAQENRMLVNCIKECDSPIDISFLTPHGCDWIPLYQALKKNLGAPPVLAAILREPKQRLLSYLKMIGNGCTDISILRKICSARPCNIDNSLHAYCKSIGLPGSQAYNMKFSDTPPMPLLLDLNNTLSIDRLRSLIISNAGMPNIMFRDNLNSMASRRSEMNENNISDKDYNNFLSELIDSGCLEKDENIYANANFCATEEMLKANYNALNLSRIHPYVFIIDDQAGSITLAKTSEFQNLYQQN